MAPRPGPCTAATCPVRLGLVLLRADLTCAACAGPCSAGGDRALVSNWTLTTSNQDSSMLAIDTSTSTLYIPKLNSIYKVCVSRSRRMHRYGNSADGFSDRLQVVVSSRASWPVQASVFYTTTFTGNERYNSIEILRINGCVCLDAACRGAKWWSKMPTKQRMGAECACRVWRLLAGIGSSGSLSKWEAHASDGSLVASDNIALPGASSGLSLSCVVARSCESPIPTHARASLRGKAAYLTAALYGTASIESARSVYSVWGQGRIYLTKYVGPTPTPTPSPSPSPSPSPTPLPTPVIMMVPPGDPQNMASGTTLFCAGQDQSTTVIDGALGNGYIYSPRAGSRNVNGQHAG